MGSNNQQIGGTTTIVFVAALVAAFLSILVLSSCGNGPSSANLSPDSSVAQAAVFNCFCTELKAERHAEAEKTSVPTTVWPMYDSVQGCIETQLNMDKDNANSAWLDVRENGRLSGINNGVTACSAGGYDVAETTPEPTNPEVMNRARKIYCDMATSGPDGGPSENRMVSELTGPYHITKTLAEAALNRAASENTASMFNCPGQ